MMFVVLHIPPDLPSRYNANFTKQRRGNRHRGFQALFNVCDGVITVTDITYPPAIANEDLVETGHGRWVDIGDLIGAMHARLRAKRDARNNDQQDDINEARAMAGYAIETGEPLPRLPQSVFGSWLPGLLVKKTGIGPCVMEKNNFRSWLNYVAMHVSSVHQSTRSIIDECLLHENIAGVTSIPWEERRTFNVGHW